jgi:hypothetical protein
MLEKVNPITIGCDPEIFVGHMHTKAILSAHGLLKGDKLNPEPVDQGAIQIDGVALEFNINPAHNLKEFLGNIRTVMQQLEQRIRTEHPNLVFRIEPTAHFDADYFNTIPPENRKLGCEPDFNVYTGKRNPPPNPDTLMRTAAGHIHIGWTEDEDPFDPTHTHSCHQVVKQLDAALYSVSTLWDNDYERRKLYGAKGAYRPKSYGVEYRVLSNAWLRTPQLQAWIYMATIRALELLGQGVRLFEKDTFAIASAYRCHHILQQDYGFPRIPGTRNFRRNHATN